MSSGPVERRRGVVLLYTLSVLMIILSLGYVYTQTSYSLSSGIGAAGYQQLAYQAALSGQAWGLSYIQQLVDNRNHARTLGGSLLYPSVKSEPASGCGFGTHTIYSMEPWAGRERCAQTQCNLADALAVISWCPDSGGATSGVAGGQPMEPLPAWFHFADVVVPDTANVVRYRLWFRLQLSESLTRNGYFYSDKRDNVNFECGQLDGGAMAADTCTPTPYGMMTGPFTPCGRCGNQVSGPYMAPYPASDRILYTLRSIGVVQADPQANNASWTAVAWSRVDTGFQIQVGGILEDPGPGGCKEFKDMSPLRRVARLAPGEANQINTMIQMSQFQHAQPYIYFKELTSEVVRAPSDRAARHGAYGPYPKASGDAVKIQTQDAPFPP